jgi:hypothetical protein
MSWVKITFIWMLLPFSWFGCGLWLFPYPWSPGGCPDMAVYGHRALSLTIAGAGLFDKIRTPAWPLTDCACGRRL